MLSIGNSLDCVCFKELVNAACKINHAETSKKKVKAEILILDLTAANHMLDRLMWKKEVLAMLVTGDLTCCLA